MAPPRNPNPDYDKAPATAAPPKSGGGFSYTPPPKKGPALSKGYVFTEWMKKHPNMKGYSDLIWKWAGQYGVDPVYLAALINAESGGNAAVVNKQGSVGLAQIHMGTWKGQQTPWGETIDQAWAQNPANAVRFAAWYFSQGVAQAGSYEGAYTQHYNPNDPNNHKAWNNIIGSIPKGYVPRGSGLSPADSASVSVETAAEKAAITSVWATRTKDGKVAFVKSAEPPKNTIKSFGQPVDQAGFLKAKQYYNDIYQSYVGKNAPDEAIAHILNSGLSDGGLAIRLSKAPAFKAGTIYKSRAGSIKEYSKNVLGKNVDDDFVRRAIVENWNEGTLVSNLKKRPEYLKGPEFKKAEAGLLNVHMSIMGRPDQAASVGIKEAVLGGWSSDQYAAYLRGSDAYKFSPELQSKQLAFAEAMGLITGKVPTLQPGQATGVPQPNITAPPPNSARIPGAPGLNPANGLVVR